MDVISAAVATSRAGRAVARLSRFAGQWGVRFPAVNGVGLHIVRKGSPWLVPEHGPAVPLGPGSIVFVPHGPVHGFAGAPARFADLPAEATPEPQVCAVDFVSCCYHLDRGAAPELFHELPDVIILAIDDERFPAVRTLADLLGEHAADPRPGNELALAAVVDLLLIHLLRQWQDGADPAAVQDPPVAAVLRTIRDDPAKPWTVRQLSTLAGMSPASFTRRFAAVTGETPGAYLTRARLDRGARLLRHTGLPLAEIAGQSGYATEFSFSAAFRREYGLAPGRFRQREKAGERDR
ncbi:AraC family transcriptional regulator [Actinoplanes sp. NBRC 101535]|uniref:AraC family transcriptional regulator n=1 Tax=Actinoplanes sp. NBRC 101535 TaxID=3032196 RepID=UPI0024A435AA|nr:AraC family transcriptional regulator [Actinoplanes sp. NBRC 101535]GLY08119.1 AraC family transcriptional regulator [Actinoplanes sp. NBRC 101535]